MDPNGRDAPRSACGCSCTPLRAAAGAFIVAALGLAVHAHCTTNYSYTARTAAVKTASKVAMRLYGYNNNAPIEDKISICPMICPVVESRT